MTGVQTWCSSDLYEAETELYLNGIGEPQHFPEALQLFQLAAAQGHARASYCVRYMHEHCHVVHADGHSANANGSNKL